MVNHRNPDFEELWDSCRIDNERQNEVSRVCIKITNNASRYKAVELATNVPWMLIAALHYRETSLDFSRCLHNGDPLPGPTVRVPKGRGPFGSWEESAADALRLVGMNRVRYLDEVSMLVMAEKFNGLGYRRTGELSPYIWAGTNHHDETGKYVADGKFDPAAKEKQLGVAAIIKSLAALR